MLDVVSVLSDLVRIPSQNPMGRPVAGPEYLEARVSDYLVTVLQRLGVEWERVEISPGRANVLARLPGTPGLPTIVLDAHQDTVPVDGMVIPPYEPAIRDGKLYGRGSCDIKGGMAAMLTMFSQWVAAPPNPRPTIVCTFTCDEEATSLGIDHLTDSWQPDATKYRLLPEPPAVAIVAEPTLLDAVVAHRGAVRWRISTTGRACHSSRPEEGVNAIYRMGVVLKHLEAYAQWLPRSRPAHHLCGTATFSVGIISGGLSVNAVPDRCTIEIDRRVLPGEDATHVIPEVVAYLKARLDFDVEHAAPFVMSPPLGDELNTGWASRLLTAIEPVTGLHQQIGVAYGTHASRFAQVGVPAVVFGPGDIAQAHTKDEWLAIEQLMLAVQCYDRFCRSVTA
jgi:succinyl-diaminopimelate desuccinylase